MEKTFVLFKPDSLQKGILGEVLSRFEKKGLKLIAAKFIQLEDKKLDEHYAHLIGKPFFPRVKEFMKSAPVLATVWEGKDAVEVVRLMCGPTNSRLALPGSIRGDYGISMQCNIVHASDSKESAVIEVKRFFSDSEIFPWNKLLEPTIYAEDERK